MIERVGTLYVGHVALERQGFDGPPVNERCYTNEHLTTALDWAASIAETSDELGLDTLWFAEHHFQREGYECLPNALMLAVHLASRTQRLRFGCAFNVAPIWHPLRLAEDFALADILTGGRVRFGVGRGYHARELEVFGVPMQDQNANRDLFEEQVGIILKAFREQSFSHQGKSYTIPPKVQYRGYELSEVTVVPRPLHQPVECWQPIVSANPRGLNFMAQQGIKGFVGGGAAISQGKGSIVNAWRETLARHGRETALGGDLIAGFNVFIADSHSDAIQQLKPYIEEHQKMFGPLGFLGQLSARQLTDLGHPATAARAGLPSVEAMLASGAWIVGSPDAVADRLLSIEQAYPGLNEIMVGHAIGSPLTMIKEQLRLFSVEVLPRLSAWSHAKT